MTERHPPASWRIPTALSAVRVLLPIPIGYFLLAAPADGRLWAAAVILVGVLTDFLDGHFARRWHQVTEIGKILDPIADKIAVGAVAVFLVVLGDLPLWYVALIIVRDLIILAGGMLIRKRKHIVPQSNLLGKIAVTLVAAALFLATIRVEALDALQAVALWLSVVVMALSLGVYAGRLSVGVRHRGEEAHHAV